MFELKEDSLELQNVTKDALVSWSDDKKRDFVKTFQERAKSAQNILIITAREIIQLAKKRKFISQKHINILNKSYSFDIRYSYDGRNWEDINKVAVSRATNTLKDLPKLSKAISVIQPEISKKIIERQSLVDKCKALVEKYNAANEIIVMSEVDQKMTVGDFLKMVKDREKQKNKLVLEINELSKEAQVLEGQIDKALYSGIPGLSDAVVKAIRDHMEKSKALDQMTRRVEEQVMFGDSQAAMDILKNFEKDEQKISSEIKAEFDNALKVLKLGSKQTKSLKAK